MAGLRYMNAQNLVVYIINLNKRRNLANNNEKKIASGFENIAKLILKFGGNVQAKNNFGWTPLQHAIVAGKLNVAKLYIKASGSDVNTVNKDGLTPMHEVMIL